MVGGFFMFITSFKITVQIFGMYGVSIYLYCTNNNIMNIQDKMKMAAAEIKERIATGEKVSSKDMKFLKSYLNIDTTTAPGAGKQWNSKKSGINR
jgi:hypothetical protein